MIRRAFKGLVAFGCFASLLLSLGTAWLWWRSRHMDGDEGGDGIHVCGGGLYAHVESWSGMAFTLAWGLPPPSPLRVAAQWDSEAGDAVFGNGAPWQFAGIRGCVGRATVYLAPDGQPIPWNSVDPLPGPYPPAVREVRGLGYFEAYYVPYAVPLVLFAVPPALWIGVNVRRVLTRRGRRRAGRCLTCGYDLRESPGRCPECGESPAASLDVR